MDFTEIADPAMIARSDHDRRTVFLDDQRPDCFESPWQCRTAVHRRIDPSTGRTEIYKPARRVHIRICQRSMTG